MASDVTGPTVDPALEALEAAAAALRADLAARGVPADGLPEPVVLALAVVVERIEQLERRFDSLYELPTLTLPPRAGILQSALDRVRDQIQERLTEVAQDVTRRVRDQVPAPIDLDAHLPPFDGQVDDVRVFDRVVGPDELRRLVDPPPEPPRFRHDCPDCVFLGRSADGARDLYHCPEYRLLHARYGDDWNHDDVAGDGPGRPEDYANPYHAEAHRRAVARGPVGGAGAGEGG